MCPRRRIIGYGEHRAMQCHVVIIRLTGSPGRKRRQVTKLPGGNLYEQCLRRTRKRNGMGTNPTNL
eukprot:746656-Hanusia_phi.AAC.1